MADDRQVKRRRVTGADIDAHDNTGGVLQSQYQNRQHGDVSVSGGAVHQGDNHGSLVHNHFYDRLAAPLSQREDEKLERLLESLTFERMDARLYNVRAALPQTCSWIFQHDLFKTWMDEEQADRNGFIWIKGKPGCGKSTIMKHTLQHVSKLVKNMATPWTVLSYFFNARTANSLEKSALGLYRSLVHSIVTHVPDLQPHLLHNFGWKIKGDEVDEWTAEELQNFLIEIVQGQQVSYGSLCIFIDALDEGKEDDIRSMISFLDDLASHAADSNRQLRICFSSRHYPCMAIPRALELTVENEAAHNEDIRLYIRKKLAEGNTTKMTPLRDELYAKSANIFLWLYLVIPLLNTIHARGGSVQDMANRLNEIPADLNGLFTEILARSSEKIHECVALLQWVLFSFRPVRAPELYLAIQTSMSGSRMGEMQSNGQAAPDADELERFLLTTSRGLVELTRAKPPIVQFIHETVRYYLVSAGGLSEVDSTLSTNVEGLSHEELRKACFAYIRQCRHWEGYRTKRETQPDFVSRLSKQYPLLEYAVNHAYRHADQAHACGVSQQPFIQDKQDSDECWRDTHFRLWRDELQHLETRRYRQKKIPLIYFLAEQGLSNLAEAAIAMRIDVNARGGRFQTALQAACVAGDQRMVQLLLDNGAEVNLNGGEHRHAAVAAILGKKFQILDILRDSGAEVPEQLLRTTLMTMIARGSAPAVQAVLQMGADTKWKNSRGQTALLLAVEKRQVEVAKLLVSHGADLTDPNLLNAAIRTRDLETIHFVLEVAEDPHYHMTCGSALVYAIETSLVSIAQALLNTGADMHNLHRDMPKLCSCVDLDTSFRLHFHSDAVRSVATNIVKLITKKRPKKVELDAALRISSKMGNLLITRLLLDAGANFHSTEDPDDVPLTPAGEIGDSLVHMLFDAAEKLYTETVEQLWCFAMRARNPAVTGKLFELASSSGISYKVLCKLLWGAIEWVDATEVGKMIDRLGSIGLRDYGGRTLLHAAAGAGQADIIKELADRGADVNALNMHGSSPLHYAVRQGSYGAAKMLLDNGADVNCRGSLELSLPYSSRELLLNRRFRHQDDTDGKLCTSFLIRGFETPLAISIAKDDLELTKLLLDRGAQANVSLRWEGTMTVLEAAVYLANVEVVESLIAAGAGILPHAVDEKMWKSSMEIAKSGISNTPTGSYSSILASLERGTVVQCRWYVKGKPQCGPDRTPFSKSLVVKQVLERNFLWIS